MLQLSILSRFVTALVVASAVTACAATAERSESSTSAASVGIACSDSAADFTSSPKSVLSSCDDFRSAAFTIDRCQAAQATLIDKLNACARAFAEETCESGEFETVPGSVTFRAGTFYCDPHYLTIDVGCQKSGSAQYRCKAK